MSLFDVFRSESSSTSPHTVYSSPIQKLHQKVSEYQLLAKFDRTRQSHNKPTFSMLGTNELGLLLRGELRTSLGFLLGGGAPASSGKLLVVILILLIIVGRDTRKSKNIKGREGTSKLIMLT